MEKKINVVLGIGNPGENYIKTRHNIGFEVIDSIADHFSVSFQPSSFYGAIATVSQEGGLILLVKPLTFVNLSGKCAASIMAWYNLPVESLFVVVDDMDLPVGRIRIRRKGGSGGHKGILSIIETLENSEFPRLRIGIGKESDAVEHVLSQFKDEERTVIDEIIPICRDAVIFWAFKGIDAAMNCFNSISIERREKS